MAATGQNFTIYSGDTLNLAFTVTGDAGTAVDLSDASLQWQLAVTASGPAKISKTSDDGSIQITDGPAGKLNVSLQSDDTAALKAGRYYHELAMTDEGGDFTTLALGTVTLKPALIKPGA